MPKKEKTILWIDDELYTLTNYKVFLEQKGNRVVSAYSLSEGKKLLKRNHDTVDLIILDIMMDIGERAEVEQSEIELAKGGYEAGLVLARWIKKTFPNLPILVYSAALVETQTLRWLEENGIRFRPKSALFESIENFVGFISESAKQRRRQKKSVRTFIVHGHDHKAKLELKNYIQNTLHLGEPVVLHEQPSRGRTVIEKFEQETQDISLVFVLLTPDDFGPRSAKLRGDKRRARQNVILELGYFLGKLERKNGRVLLLYKGDLELPSDISGLIYIDISGGIEYAGEIIRREIRGLI